MKYTTFTILGLLAHVSTAQNLLPNPDFENYSECPNTIGLIQNTTGWISWNGSPDYHNACSPGTTFDNQQIDVPSNGFGYQEAHSGSGYTGFYGCLGNGVPNYREFMACQFHQPLDIGTTYYFSMYVSNAYCGYFWSTYSCNNLGIFLCTNGEQYDYLNGDPLPIPNYSQWYYEELVSDTSEWVLLSGNFVADSAYTHLAIGNFFDDSMTEAVNNSEFPSGGGYYYIDDVCLSTNAECAVNPSVHEVGMADKLARLNGNLYSLHLTMQPELCTLYNSSGMPFSSFRFGLGDNLVDLSQFSQGLYFLELLSPAQSKKQVFKLIKN
ncbi:MAG: hypothetical protein SH856_07420 [Flavobacteriales bacterium]|nr:hypothetical protein [Flavobacteriales bacterium]